MAPPDSNDIPREITLEWLAYRQQDFHRRLRQLEGRDEKYDPAVTDERMKVLSQDVRALKRAFYTFAFSSVGAAIVFALSVFAQRGR